MMPLCGVYEQTGVDGQTGVYGQIGVNGQTGVYRQTGVYGYKGASAQTRDQDLLTESALVPFFGFSDIGIALRDFSLFCL